MHISSFFFEILEILCKFESVNFEKFLSISRLLESLDMEAIVFRTVKFAFLATKARYVYEWKHSHHKDNIWNQIIKLQSDDVIKESRTLLI